MTAGPRTEALADALWNAMYDADRSHGGYECCAPSTHASAEEVLAELTAAGYEVASSAELTALRAIRDAAAAVKLDHDANGHRDPCAVCAAVIQAVTELRDRS